MKHKLAASVLLLLGVVALPPGGFADEQKVLHLQDYHTTPVSTANAPARGPENAKVTVVEFMDYSCPFCIRTEPAFRKVIADNQDKVRFVIKHHWIAPHKHARLAAQVAIAADLQGKFWPVHEMLLDKHFAGGPKGATIEGYLPYLKDIPGLDLERLQRDVNSPEVNARLDAEIKDVRGSSATPEFVINGHLITGERTEEQLNQLIKEAQQ